MTKLQAIRQVQKAAEEAMDAAIGYITTSVSPTSEEAHAIIDTTLALHNCESPNGHIVASGVQSVQPHEIGHGPLSKNTPIVIDIYPCSKETGYYADITRTICLRQPSRRLQEMYDAVLQAQEHAFTLLKPGASCAAVHTSVASFLQERGFKTSGKGTEFAYAEGFVHGLGHGVSTDIHDAPHISSKSKDVLTEGDVVAIEPGLYYNDIGGIRIEDLVLITKDGCENLATFSKRFVYDR